MPLPVSVSPEKERGRSVVEPFRKGAVLSSFPINGNENRLGILSIKCLSRRKVHAEASGRCIFSERCCFLTLVVQ